MHCRAYSFKRYRHKGFDSVLLYLQHHQQYFTSLELTGLDPSQLWIELVLPTCSAVEKLVLHQWSVQLGPQKDALLTLLAQRPHGTVNDSMGAAAGRAAGTSSSGVGPLQPGGSGSNGGSSWQDPLGVHSSSRADTVGLHLDDSSSLREVLASTRSHQGLLQGLPALKELHMLNCCASDHAEDLGAVAAAGVLPGLTNLEHLVAEWKDGDTPDALLTGVCVSAKLFDGCEVALHAVLCGGVVWHVSKSRSAGCAASTRCRRFQLDGYQTVHHQQQQQRLGCCRG